MKYSLWRGRWCPDSRSPLAPLADDHLGAMSCYSRPTLPGQAGPFHVDHAMMQARRAQREVRRERRCCGVARVLDEHLVPALLQGAVDVRNVIAVVVGAQQAVLAHLVDE